MKHTPARSALALLLALCIGCPALGSAPFEAQTEPDIQTTRPENAAGERAPNPFRINGKPPKAGYITHLRSPISPDLLESEMIAQLAGLVGTIKPRSFSGLRRGISSRPVEQSIMDALSESTILGYLHLQRDSTLRIYEVHQGDAKFMILRSVADPTQAWSLQTKALDRLGIKLLPPSDDLAQGTSHEYEADAYKAIGGVEFIMPQPYIESPTVLNPKIIRARIKAQYPKLTRKPSEELYRVRLPKGYDPDTPAGILIWISPMPDGRIPAIFEPALDNLGLIAIGIDNNGNQRPITDRLQNHLDSIETIAQHYRIDRSRIYLTGMSGGGRCSGILQIAFPELFAGAVPIVGLDTYHNAPTGDPGKFWPARQGRPAAKWMGLLKTRRIAAITGTADFNNPEMVIRKGLLKNDGIDMRLDIIPGMGHTMPTAAQFTSALTWVDEPRSQEAKDALKEAQALMESYQNKYGNTPPTNPVARKMLIEVLTLSPWSKPAWAAAKLLGYEKSA